MIQITSLVKDVIKTIISPYNNNNNNNAFLCHVFEWNQG